MEKALSSVYLKTYYTDYRLSLEQFESFCIKKSTWTPKMTA